MSGKPRELYVDNAAEFKSEALRRGCDQHGIGYDSDGKAVLTVVELHAWLALAVACYHGQVHEGLGRTPAGVWAEKVTEHGTPVTVTSETAFLVDFLPVIRRSWSRTGFLIDHVQYYCDALTSDIDRWHDSYRQPYSGVHDRGDVAADGGRHCGRSA